MNFPLFWSSIKANWNLLLIFTLIMLAYLMMILSMYTPDFLSTLAAAIDMVTTDIAATVGMNKIPTSLIDFVAVYFYGFLTHLFLLVHTILLPLRLMVKYVDRGSMSYLLSTPNSRLEIAVTQVVYMAASLLVMMLVLTCLPLAYTASSHPGAMDIPAFICLNFTTYLVGLAMASITFFFSCFWNNMKYAAFSSSALLGLFFIFTLLGKYGHSKGVYGIVEIFSIFQLHRAREIVMGETNMFINNGLLLLIIAIFIGSGILVFKKKDLPL